jgi:Resolvase, N terminal domain
MRFDLVTCWRSGGSAGWAVAAHLIELMAELEAERIGFQSVTESIDTTTPGGKLVFHIFGALAEFERNLIRELTYAGLAAARARGRKGGRRQSLVRSSVPSPACPSPQTRPTSPGPPARRGYDACARRARLISYIIS